MQEDWFRDLQLLLKKGRSLERAEGNAVLTLDSSGYAIFFLLSKNSTLIKFCIRLYYSINNVFGDFGLPSSLNIFASLNSFTTLLLPSSRPKPLPPPLPPPALSPPLPPLSFPSFSLLSASLLASSTALILLSAQLPTALALFMAFQQC